MEIEVSWREFQDLLEGGDSNAKALRANAKRVLGTPRAQQLLAELDAGRSPQIIPKSEGAASTGA
jgi:hypothetical protein